jgi:hypothetical protein
MPAGSCAICASACRRGARLTIDGRAVKVAAIAIVAAATIAAIAFQPIGTPWWVYADGDATYAASGIELMGGQHTNYLDHPGMPVLDLMAVTTDIRYAANSVLHGSVKRSDYVQRLLFNLDDSRVYFRGWAMAFFVFGVFIAFITMSRLFGGPLWGLAGALLWLSAPQLDLYSIRFLPDPLQAGLLVACGYLIVRAAQRRDAWTYVLAALLLGLAVTVKLHAAGLVVPLALALAWRPPGAAWRPELANGARAWLRRYRIPLAVFAAIWLFFCVVFGSSRVPFSLTHEQSTLLLELAAALVLYFGVVLLYTLTPLRDVRPRVLSPLGVILVSALLVGVLLPATLFINDLPEMLVKIADGLTGHGVNEGVTPFTVSWSTLLHGPLVYTVMLVGIAGVAALVGLARRDPTPVLWFAGAAATFAMALARLGTPHYFQPAFVLSIPAALWLASRLPRRFDAIAATALVLGLGVPTAMHIHAPANWAAQQERQGKSASTLLDSLVTKPGTIALSDDYAPSADVRWYSLVGQYLPWVPLYPYRILPITVSVNQLTDRHVVPSYYIGQRSFAVDRTLATSLGTYEVQQVATGAEGMVAAHLVHGPGVDQPLAP